MQFPYDIVRSSLKYYAAFLLIDGLVNVAAFAVTGAIIPELFYILAFIGAAGMFISGGFLDFSESYVGTGIRGLTSEEPPRYSADRHKTAQKRGAALILSGVFLILTTIVLSSIL